MPPQLVYELEGNRVVFSLGKDEVTIGRSTSNDVVIEQISVSRRHAMLYREGEAWKVKDLGSTFGTTVNDLGHTNTTLKDGDRILLHRFPITFRAEDSPGVSLHQVVPTAEFGGGTIYQSARNFSAIAAVSANVVHLQKLLAIVTKTSEVILASRSLDETFSKVLELVFEHLPIQRGFIMLWDEDKQDFVTRCVKNLADADSKSEIQFSRTIAEKVLRERVGVLTTDALADDRFAAGHSVQALGIRSAMAAPLWTGENVVGLLYVDTPLKRKAFGNDDLDLLCAVGNHIAVSIEQSRLQSSVMQQELVRRRLERYHSPAVIERITASRSQDDVLVAEEREVTLLFADVVGFTDRCEGMEPRHVAELLNRYFSEMTEVIFRHEGTLDKFIGDCMMAVFGAPLPAEDHPQRAARAALDMRVALRDLNAGIDSAERFRFRVGIHSGKVVAGDIGSVRRSDYTVLGSTVNLASRLEAYVAEPDQIIVSDVTHAAIDSEFEMRFVGKHQPKGISREVHCYELVGRKT